ncbi:acetyltransferase [Mesorhizobium australafricanum]|uniref:Acetyltransferase n=1 Tax=Mesorhizobium australafricanum TaxID=3072311 RepID=A0ABU4X4J9_9HYPH|nr:acetyltransferase [Mesorhizobium sp. VK3E]MDX8441999.1 acetyltransferase [Mesorhizobium sp. VK3E]
MNIRAYEAGDNARLVDIWVAAVRATHHFLNEDDIQFFLPQLRDQYLPALEVFVAVDQTGQPTGFAGFSQSKLEMLFVDPRRHGSSIGRRLIDHAVALKGPLEVDVNEQNPGAIAFYGKCGFMPMGRSELDGSGKPFPLIHMAQPG